MKNLDAALAYADRGWPVFPCHPESRAPLLACDKDAYGRDIRNTGGVRKASTNPEAIRAWWGKWPWAVVAAAAGEPIGAFVVDVDVKNENGREALALAEDENGRLPSTWEAITPSGGLHLYFAMPVRQLRNRVGVLPGVDIRTTGGSITLPPSRRKAGVYRWVTPPVGSPARAPKWILDIIAPPTTVRPSMSRSSPVSDRYAQAALVAECAEVAATAPGAGRNHRLFQAAARLGELVAADALSTEAVEAGLMDAAQRCGLHVDDGGVRGVEATIASGLRRGRERPRSIRQSAVTPEMRALLARQRGTA